MFLLFRVSLLSCSVHIIFNIVWGGRISMCIKHDMELLLYIYRDIYICVRVCVEGSRNYVVTESRVCDTKY